MTDETKKQAHGNSKIIRELEASIIRQIKHRDRVSEMIEAEKTRHEEKVKYLFWMHETAMKRIREDEEKIRELSGEVKSE